MVPRLVKLFDFPGRGATQIYAGYTCSFAVSEVGRCLFAPTRLPRSHVQGFPSWPIAILTLTYLCNVHLSRFITLVS